MAFQIKLPDSLPILSFGGHEDPSKGACFMEYTALLAGEDFSDTPLCVDAELTQLMQHMNDTLHDLDRPKLTAFLGRGIGLVAPKRPRPASAAYYMRLSGEKQRKSDDRYNARLTKWNRVGFGFQADVRKKLQVTYPQLKGKVLNLSSAITWYMDEWITEQDIEELDINNGRHVGCDSEVAHQVDGVVVFMNPPSCPHIGNPSQKALVDKWLEVAEAVHTAYEEVMAERGWEVKRELACELPQVADMVGSDKL